MRRRWLYGLFAVLVLLAAAVVWGLVSPVGELVFRNLLGQTAAYITDEDGRVVAVLPRELDHHVNPRDKSQDIDNLDGTLNGIVQLYETEGLEAAMSAVPIAGSEPGTVDVIIYQELFFEGSGSTAEIAAALQSMEIEHLDRGDNYLFASVPIEQLETVARLEHIQFIMAKFPLEPLQGGNPTAQVNTAEQIHGAEAWHDAFKGQGVKIGVIDAGFATYDSLQQKGIVPVPADAACFVYRRKPNSLGVCRGKDAIHGTAVVESLMKVAPAATVYLAQVSAGEDLGPAVDWLIDREVDIINMSLEFPWDSSMKNYRPGSILSQVGRAVSNNITWVNAAGNQNNFSWFGNLSQGSRRVEELLSGLGLNRPWHRWYTSGYRFDHEFGTFDWRLAGNTCNIVELKKREHLKVWLRWDDTWGSSDLDLDIQVYSTSGVPVPGTRRQVRQNGEPRDYPMEQFRSVLKLFPGSYCIQVHNYSDAHGQPQPPLLTWLQLSSTHELKYSTGSSLAHPAGSANPGLIAVGAANYDSNDTIAWYSSRGPTIDGRIKPDLVGVDGVPTYSYEIHGKDDCEKPDDSDDSDEPDDSPKGHFCGTSQAAPHVAGLAALVKERFSEFSPKQVADYLKVNALARPGSPNNIWGHGLAHLPTPGKAVVATTPTPVTTLPPRPTPNQGTLVPISGTPEPSAIGTANPTATVVSTPVVVATPLPLILPPDLNCPDVLQGVDLQTDAKTLETPLHRAAKEGSFERVLCLLTGGADSNARDDGGRGPLHYLASSVGDTSETIEVLLAGGADPNLQNTQGGITHLPGQTPLHWAVQWSVPEVVMALLTGGADPNLGDNGLKTSLHVTESSEVAQMLLDAGANPNARDDGGRGPLHYQASSVGDTSETIEVLLAGGADPNLQNTQGGITHLPGQTPLHWAVQWSVPEVVMALLTGGADPNLGDNGLKTSLHVTESSEVAQMLLDAGANPNARDDGGRGPLHYLASSVGDTSETIEVLLAGGADPNLQNTQGGITHLPGQTPLHWAVQWSVPEVVMALLTGGADPNLGDNGLKTSLHVTESSEVAQMLLDAGANPNARDDGGRGPLHYLASSVGDTSETIEVLLAGGADPNLQNTQGGITHLPGQTPLHWAVQWSVPEVVMALLTGGADPNLADDSGTTPLDMAQENSELARLLLAAATKSGE